MTTPLSPFSPSPTEEPLDTIQKDKDERINIDGVQPVHSSESTVDQKQRQQPQPQQLGTTTTHPASPRPNYRLTRDEKNDLIASLEHIVATGNQIRRSERRISTWRLLNEARKRRRNDKGKTTRGSSSNSNSNSNGRKRKRGGGESVHERMSESRKEEGERKKGQQFKQLCGRDFDTGGNQNGAATIGGGAATSNSSFTTTCARRMNIASSSAREGSAEDYKAPKRPHLVHAEDWRIYRHCVPSTTGDVLIGNDSSSSSFSSNDDRDEETKKARVATMGAWPESSRSRNMRLRSRQKVRNKGNDSFRAEQEENEEQEVRNNWRLTIDDTEWDDEHGDGVHPLEFSDACLSPRFCQNDDGKEGDAGVTTGGLSTQKTAAAKDQRYRPLRPFVERGVTTVTEDDVPRAFLLRCWQRAVHAAACDLKFPYSKDDDDEEDNVRGRGSCEGHTNDENGSGGVSQTLNPYLKESETLQSSVSMEGNESSTTTGDANSEVHSKSFPVNLPETRQSNREDVRRKIYTYEAAVQKCSDLNIEWIPNSLSDSTTPDAEGQDEPTPLTCQSCCASDFNTLTELQTHFWGNDQTKGCCWRLIERKQFQMINNALLTEFMTVTDGLLHVILSKAKLHLEKKKNERDVDRKYTNMLNWENILDFLNSTVVDARCCSKNTAAESVCAGQEEEGSSILDTIQIHPDAPPITLNKEIMSVISRRMIDRYAVMRR